VQDRRGRAEQNAPQTGRAATLRRGTACCRIFMPSNRRKDGEIRREPFCDCDFRPIVQVLYNRLSQSRITLGGAARMIRSELIQKIADENPHLYQRDVERIVNTIFEEIIEAMARGDRVELRGFGAFSVKKRDARTGRNPRTGEAVEVEEKHVPFFKTGKLLRDRLNDS
tara:strand:+ start:739 stop:1245 length:507 start_codon:yes stop_codon:yes gene_type:complete